MKCIILAAGYATRLYPLTENFPKPLLKVGGKTILDWLIDDIHSTGKVSEYVIISNNRYYDAFVDFKNGKDLPITVINDGTNSNDDRLGAVKDIAFAIKELKINDDIMIIAGDNLLDFSLKSFIDFFECKNKSTILCYYEPQINKLQKCGVVELDSTAKIISMEEKPSNPKSHFCVPPFYICKKTDIPLIEKAIKDGINTDAPGSLIAYLACNTDVFAMQMQGKRFDIGNLESYKCVQDSYKGITNE